MIDEELTMRAILGMPPPDQPETQQDDPVEYVIVPEEIITVETMEEILPDDPETHAENVPVLEDAVVMTPTLQVAAKYSMEESPSLTEKQYYVILGMREVIKFLNDRKENLERQVNIPEKTIIEKLETEIAARTIAGCITEAEKYMHKCIQSTENKKTIH